MRNVRERVEKHPIAQLMGFMNEVAVNLIRDDARKQKRQPQWESLDAAVGDANDGDGATLADRVADAEADVSEEALSPSGKAALQRVVRQAFGELSQQQQAIIQLDVANEGTLSDKEIAEILHTQYARVTANTVRNQRSRARDKLRESLQALRAKDANVDELLSDFLSRWRDA